MVTNIFVGRKHPLCKRKVKADLLKQTFLLCADAFSDSGQNKAVFSLCRRLFTKHLRISFAALFSFGYTIYIFDVKKLVVPVNTG